MNAFAGATTTEALAAQLLALPVVEEGWWSPHYWRRHACPTRGKPDRIHEASYRCSAGWAAAGCVVIDPDYHDADGDHGQPTPEAAAALVEAARAGLLPGSIFSATVTGRSTRVIAVFPEVVINSDIVLATTRGLGTLVDRALRDLGLAARVGADGIPRSGYVVDTSAMDLARQFWRPRCILNGELREAEVLVMRNELIAAEDLLSHAPAPAPPPAAKPSVRRPARAADSSDDLIASWRRWVDDHPRDWGAPGSNLCPACTRPGFGRLPSQPWRWCCWSASHGVRTAGRCGRERSGKWIGDGVHMEAFHRGCRPVDVLRRDGYLSVRRGRRGHGVSPAALAGALRSALSRLGQRRVASDAGQGGHL